MGDDADPDVRQRRSWELNADAWTEAIRGGVVTSREAGTNAAVLDAVRACGPKTVLDVGCGEGWLAHALAEEGTSVVGVDASARLIRAASDGPGRFVVAEYASLTNEPAVVPGPFDVVVCNFSLLDEDLVPLLDALRRRLAPVRGRLVVQTLHPWVANGERPYRDGWRLERFDAFGRSFPAAMPWYFRTLASWWRTLGAAGLDIARLEEPGATTGDASPSATSPSATSPSATSPSGALLSLLIVAAAAPPPTAER